MKGVDAMMERRSRVWPRLAALATLLVSGSLLASGPAMASVRPNLGFWHGWTEQRFAQRIDFRVFPKKPFGLGHAKYERVGKFSFTVEANCPMGGAISVEGTFYERDFVIRNHFEFNGFFPTHILGSGDALVNLGGRFYSKKLVKGYIRPVEVYRPQTGERCESSWINWKATWWRS